ncbi:rplM [Symbiodinium sp. CCMP2592]|nr:rplM [Symbiodinium sp. CCMP2592]
MKKTPANRRIFKAREFAILILRFKAAFSYQSCHRCQERLKLFAGPNHLYYNKVVTPCALCVPPFLPSARGSGGSSGVSHAQDQGDPLSTKLWSPGFFQRVWAVEMKRLERAQPLRFLDLEDCTHTANLRYRDRTMQDEVVLQYKQARVDRTRLKQYRTFLSKQLQRLGEEATKDMDMEEFVAKATENEYERVAEETAGDAPVKKKENLFYETWLPKQKYSDNRNRRKGVTHIPPVQVWKEPKMEEGK